MTSSKLVKPHQRPLGSAPPLHNTVADRSGLLACPRSGGTVAVLPRQCRRSHRSKHIAVPVIRRSRLKHPSLAPVHRLGTARQASPAHRRPTAWPRMGEHGRTWRQGQAGGGRGWASTAGARAPHPQIFRCCPCWVRADSARCFWCALWPLGGGKASFSL